MLCCGLDQLLSWLYPFSGLVLIIGLQVFHFSSRGAMWRGSSGKTSPSTRSNSTPYSKTFLPPMSVGLRYSSIHRHGDSIITAICFVMFFESFFDLLSPFQLHSRQGHSTQRDSINIFCTSGINFCELWTMQCVLLLSMRACSYLWKSR